MRPTRLLLWLTLFALAPMAAAQSFWEATPGPYGGTVVHALAQTPDGAVLAATEGGIYRSDDDGQTWRADSDGLVVREVRALLVRSDGVTYAATYGHGVYHRGVGATTWKASTLGLNFATTLAEAPDGTLFAGTAAGLYVSIDGGTSWQIRLIDNRAYGVQALAVNAGYVFVGTPQGLFRSNDGGTMWEFASLGLEDYNVTAITVNDEGHVFAGTSPKVGGCSLYRSRGNGGFWTCIQPPTDPLLVKALATGADGALYMGGYRLIGRSEDEGDKWSQAVAVPTTVHAVLPLESGVLLGGSFGRGVVRSTDRGLSWADANEGLLSTFHDLLLAPNGDLYVGTAGGVFHSTDRGTSWTLLDEGQPFAAVRTLVLDAEGDLVVGTINGAYRLDVDDATAAWEALGPPGNPVIRDLALAPNGDLYAGYYGGLYQLHGRTWTPMPIIGPDAAVRDVVAVGITPDGTLLAGSSYDAFRLDEALGWTRLSLDTTPFFEIQSFAFFGQNVVYGGTRYFGVTRSDDGGRTWTMQSGGLLGQEDMRTLAFDADGVLHAGSFGNGVFRYDTATRTWQSFNSGLAHLRAVALAFDPAGNGYVGTHGGGLYRHRAEAVVAVEPDAEVPEAFALRGNYPNPFNPVTTLTFSLPAPASVSVSVVDVLGRQVLTVPPQPFGAGTGQTLRLDASALPSGLYLYRLTARSGAAVWHGTGRMTLVK